MFKLVVGITFILFSVGVHSAAGWSGKTKVEGVYILNENTALIKLDSFSNPHQCDTNESGDIRINPSKDKAWFSVLLSAYMADKTVNIYVSGSCTQVRANTSYATVSHIRLL